MAAKGDSKQGLIVTLIFFILLSILLGITTFIGFNGQADLEKSLEEAKKKENAAKTDTEYYQMQSLVGRGYTAPLGTKELDELGSKMDKFTAVDPQTKKRKLNPSVKNRDAAEVDAWLGKLQDKLGWNEAQKKPASTFETLLAQRDKEIEELKNTVKNEQDKAAKESEKLKAQNDKLAARELQYKTELDALRSEPLQYVINYLKGLPQGELDKQLEKVKQEKLGQMVAHFVKTIDELQKEVDNLGQVRTNLQEQIGAQEEKHQKQVKAMQKEIDDLNLRVSKAEAKVPRINLLDFDQPKGKIVEIDRSGLQPFINLGRADNVKPGLTFSIRGADANGKSGQEPKGSLEVLSVINDRLSQARVTWLKDPNRDPVMKGDLLFNPAWSPTLRQHVAIAGIVDLTGEAGKENPAQTMRSLLEFKRTLEEQGIVVDAYLDLREGVVKGEITRQTDFLIEGDAPGFAGAEALRDEDVRGQKKANLATQMAKMHQEAVQLGVTPIPLRKFLIWTGYRLPRPVITGGGASTPSTRPYGSGVPSPLDRLAPTPQPTGRPPLPDDKDKQPKPR
jgi:phage host-nuclease inhibitor protein Gam